MKFEGFNRVIVNFEGEAWTPSRAAQIGVLPDVGFMRKDGWSLGAPKELESVAYRMWADEWVYKIEKPQSEWIKLRKD